MTITNLVKEYMDEGILFEWGTAPSNGGPKPALLDVMAESLITTSLYIARDHLLVSLIDLRGNILAHSTASLPEDDSGANVMQKIYVLMDNMLAHKTKGRVWGMGISVAGPLDSERGVILNPPNFPQVRNLSIVKPLEERYGLPTYIENDIRVSSLAEMYYGNAKNVSNFVYVGVTSGVGCGIIIDRELFTGFDGNAGEFAHATIDPSGPQCSCGNIGCLEQYSTTSSAIRQYRQETGKDISWLELVSLAKDGDQLCLRIIKNLQKYLGYGLVALANIFDPECIIVGDEIIYVADLVLDGLNEYVNSHKIFRARPINIIKSYFPGSAPFIGTSPLIIEHLLQHKRPRMRILQEN
jgi:predicted NBD/HSP70 family sugar kinase